MTIELLVCKQGIWKIETSGDLRQEWQTLNSWEKGE